MALPLPPPQPHSGALFITTRGKKVGRQAGMHVFVVPLATAVPQSVSMAGVATPSAVVRNAVPRREGPNSLQFHAIRRLGSVGPVLPRSPHERIFGYCGYPGVGGPGGTAGGTGRKVLVSCGIEPARLILLPPFGPPLCLCLAQGTAASCPAQATDAFSKAPRARWCSTTTGRLRSPSAARHGLRLPSPKRRKAPTLSFSGLTTLAAAWSALGVELARLQLLRVLWLGPYIPARSWARWQLRPCRRASRRRRPLRRFWARRTRR